MSRAAIFTSTALAMPACGGSKHEPEQTVLVAAVAVDAQVDPVDQVASAEAVDAAPTSPPNDAGAPVPMDAPAPKPDAAVPAVAKPTKGRATIHGTLRDSNGHAAPGYPLALFAATTYQRYPRADPFGGAGGSRTTTTTDTGAFEFPNVPAGAYMLLIEGPQSPHSSAHDQAVTVSAGESLKLDLTLYPPRPCCMPYGAPPVRRRVV